MFIPDLPSIKFDQVFSTLSPIEDSRPKHGLCGEKIAAACKQTAHSGLNYGTPGATHELRIAYYELITVDRALSYDVISHVIAGLEDNPTNLAPKRKNVNNSTCLKSRNALHAPCSVDFVSHVVF